MKDKVLIDRGLRALRARRFKEALSNFQAASTTVNADPRLVQAAFSAADSEGHFKLAENYLERLVSLLPNRFEVYSTAGTFFQNRGRYALAIEYFSRAIDLSPKEAGLYYNLAFVQFEKKEYLGAKQSVKMANKLNPNYYKGLVLEGRIMAALEFYSESIELFSRAIKIDAESQLAYFRLASVYVSLGNLTSARANYDRALECESSDLEIVKAIAEFCLSVGDHGQAKELIYRGLAMDPGNPVFNEYLADLKFELDEYDPFRQYRKSIETNSSSALLAGYIKRLLVIGDISEAERQLKVFKENYELTIPYIELYIRLLHEKGQYQKALDEISVHADQLRHKPDLQMVCLLAVGRFEEAELCGQKLVSLDGANQYFWALYGLALRATKNPLYEQLMNYGSLTKVHQLPAPEGFSSIEDFNKELGAYLNEIHLTKHHPLGQSVRHGTQTTGNLLLRQNHLVKALFKEFEKIINIDLSDDFFSNMPLQHPLKNACSRSRQVVSAWSIRVQEGGFHESHVHSKGCYSSAYYVDVPSVIRADKEKEGCLAFGLPGVRVAGDWSIEHYIQPRPGQLVLFPSYFWHGTLPFKGPGTRLAVAFDVVLS